MSAATRRDAEIRLPAQRSRRTINAAVTTPYGFDEANFYDVGYIDGGDSYFASPDDAATGLMVNQSEQRTSTYIPPEIWNQLPKSAQEILRSARKPSAPARKAAFHHHQLEHFDDTMVSSESVFVSTHDAQELPKPPDHNESTPDDSEGTILMAHLTEQKKMHPGDIRKVPASAT